MLEMSRLSTFLFLLFHYPSIFDQMNFLRSPLLFFSIYVHTNCILTPPPLLFFQNSRLTQMLLFCLLQPPPPPPNILVLLSFAHSETLTSSLTTLFCPSCLISNSYPCTLSDRELFSVDSQSLTPRTIR